jgi:DNA-binding transcriptional MerR regulator
MNLEPISKKYYTIGEVSEMIREAPSLIRFWEKEFDALKPDKTDKGTRKYSEKDIQLLKLIHYLVKQKGYTLQGAAEYIKQQSDIETTGKLVDSLTRLKGFLQTIKAALDQK